MGAFTLAAAGILDGRRATTHWQAEQLFRNTFPAVQLDADVLYVDEGQVLTSAQSLSKESGRLKIEGDPLAVLL